MTRFRNKMTVKGMSGDVPVMVREGKKRVIKGLAVALQGDHRQDDDACLLYPAFSL